MTPDTIEKALLIVTGVVLAFLLGGQKKCS